jgi:galactokinase
MTTPESAAGRSFQVLFGANPDVRADAPGRVNLIGEHVDYQGGCVLPCAIPQRTSVEMRRRADTTIRVWSALDPNQVGEFASGREVQRGTWIDYVAAIPWSLRRRGLRVPGLDVRVESTVPVGVGLSSSASLEVALLRALRALLELAIDDVQIAQIAQSAEVDFVGAPVGIMDQMAASLAAERDALFLDTRTLQYERIPLPPSIELIVISSGVLHQHAGGSYAERRAESEAAARLLGVRWLTDVAVDDLARLNSLPAVLARRARHVITEQARVIAAAAALRCGDLARLGQLFDASHVSMRDDYAVSVPEVDTLVECGRADPSVIGARLTGGGFGGAVVMLASAGQAAAAAQRIAARYRQITGLDGRVLVPF